MSTTRDRDLARVEQKFDDEGCPCLLREVYADLLQAERELIAAAVLADAGRPSVGSLHALRLRRLAKRIRAGGYLALPADAEQGGRDAGK